MPLERSKGRLQGFLSELFQFLSEEFNFLTKLFKILGEDLEFLSELFELSIVHSNITPRFCMEIPCGNNNK